MDPAPARAIARGLQTGTWVTGLAVWCCLSFLASHWRAAASTDMAKLPSLAQIHALKVTTFEGATIPAVQLMAQGGAVIFLIRRMG